MIKMSCGGPQDLKDWRPEKFLYPGPLNIYLGGAEVYDFRFSAVTKGS